MPNGSSLPTKNFLKIPSEISTRKENFYLCSRNSKSGQLHVVISLLHFKNLPKMKSTFFKFATVAAVGLVAFTSSCKKEELQPKSENKSVSEQLAALNAKYSNSTSQYARGKQPNGGRVVAADAAGAAGGAFGGPLGAFVCGATFSIYDLFQQGAFGKIVSGNPTSTNPANPYDVVGQAHNAAITDVKADLSLVGSNGVFNFDGVSAKVENFGVQNYPSLIRTSAYQRTAARDIAEPTEPAFASGAGYSEALATMRANGYIDAEVESVLNQYFGTFLNAVDWEHGQAYSFEAEAVVSNSSMSAENKARLLSAMSVARNSALLYDYF